jgi:hypothetical protein
VDISKSAVSLLEVNEVSTATQNPSNEHKQGITDRPNAEEGELMAGLTSSTITVSKYRIGDFGYRAWQVRQIITLIDAAERIWTVNPIGHSFTDGHSLQVQGVVPIPSNLPPAESLVLLLAGSVVRSPKYLQTLDSYGFAAPICDECVGNPQQMRLPAEVLSGESTVPPALISGALGSLIGVVRLGITRLDNYSQLDDTEIQALAEMNLDIDVFRIEEQELSHA